MRTTVAKISLITLFAVGVLGLTGCDSGGTSSDTSGEDEPSIVEKTDDVIVNLNEADQGSSSQKATINGTLTVDFHYENDSQEDCTLSKRENDVSPGYNGSFSPSNIAGDCENVSDFDGVRAYYKSESDTPPLTLEILTGDGNEVIASQQSDNAVNGLEAAETVSDDVGIPDEIGPGIIDEDDDSGDGGSGGGSGFSDADDVASTISQTWRTKNRDNVAWVRFNEVQPDIDLWALFSIISACDLRASPFSIVNGGTIEFLPYGENPNSSDISYSDGELRIEDFGGETLTLVKASKDPFQSRCDFSSDTYDRMGY